MVLIWDCNVDFHGKLMKFLEFLLNNLVSGGLSYEFLWSVLTGIKYLLLTSDDMNGF